MKPARVVLLVASAGGLSLFAWSVLLDPVPPALAIAAVVADVTLATAGVLIPQWEMYADVLSRFPAETERIALTFDDGPSPDTTPRVLDLLRARGHRATFFVVGKKVERHPEIVQRMRADGHGIGLHGYAHHRSYSLRPPAFVEQDVRRTQEAVAAAAGVRPTILRPPVGYVSSRTALGARRAGVVLVAWSARAIDGLKRTAADQVVRRVAAGLRPGAIVMLHDAAEREDFTPAALEALPRILDLIDERGLKTATIEELRSSARSDRR